jgi:invasion protein IalB
MPAAIMLSAAKQAEITQRNELSRWSAPSRIQPNTMSGQWAKKTRRSGPRGWIRRLPACNTRRALLLPHFGNTKRSRKKEGPKPAGCFRKDYRTMTSLATNASRLSVMAAGVVGLLAAGFTPALAQDQAAAQQPPQGWFKVCSKQQDIDICNVQNNVTAQTGQLITGISLIELKGKVNRKVFQVAVPSGRMVAPGVGLQIDSGKTQKIEYAICFPDRCVAEVQLSDQMVAAFKKGSQITLTSVNYQNQQSPVKISLAGFSDAYDGPALQQSDLEDRQKKLQDFVAKNNEDFAKKLKEEQDKAKAAN